ncbi:MAG: hypothetical protein ACRDL5_19145 [Solirubrobacteraceae bacterium]
MGARACISIPVHESPAVVLDQVANIRAFLPDAIVVLHVAQSFVAPEQLAPLLPDGVYVNETSLRTEWGDPSPAHKANFRFIDARERFDVFVLGASNDLFVRRDADRRLAQADAGVQLFPCHPGQTRREVASFALAAADPGMARLAGGGTVYQSQPEGMFFERSLFRRMVAEIEAALGTEPRPFVTHDSFWGPEHYAYPTIAARLADAIVPPILYSEVQGTLDRRPISEAVIWAISRRWRSSPVSSASVDSPAVPTPCSATCRRCRRRLAPCCGSMQPTQRSSP